MPIERDVLAVTPAPSAPRKRAVVLRALGLGDLLTCVPALRALRRGLPHHELVLLTPARFAPLVRVAGLADVVVDTLPWRPPPSSFDGADLAVNLHGRGPQSHQLLLAGQPRRLVAYACDGLAGGPHWDPDEHEVTRWCRLVDDAGFPADPGELTIASPSRPIADRVAGATVLHPGAAAPARRWPVDRWASVARHERARGQRVVLTGTGGERQLCAEVAARAGLSEDAVLAGCTDLLDLFAVVAGAVVVVCGDTGVAHVATAVGTASVVLFGPTAPAQWGPPDRPRHRVIWKGGHGDPHASATDPGLLRISDADVLAELDRLRLETVRAQVLAAPPIA